MEDLARRLSDFWLTSGIEAPILRIFRDSPVDSEDTGLCFACGRDDHVLGDWLIVGIHRLIRERPSLARFTRLPIGFLAERSHAQEEWQVMPFEESDEG